MNPPQSTSSVVTGDPQLYAPLPAPDPPGVTGERRPRARPGLHHRHLRPQTQDLGVHPDCLHCGHCLPEPAGQSRLIYKINSEQKN